MIARLRAAALWMAGILIPVALSAAVNLWTNDGVWNPPWIAFAVVLALAGWYVTFLAGRDSAPAAADLPQVKARLAELVGGFWRSEMTKRSLGDPPIPVTWHVTTRPNLMDHPHLIAEGELSFIGRSDEITVLASFFRRLRRHRLVVTGGAGTGKTTLAVQLLLKLIETREADEPVPVLLQIADWDTELYPNVHDWLVVRLRNDFLVPKMPDQGRDSARILVSGRHVLPILDGLDELPEPARAKVINRLSQTLDKHDRLIITSRTSEFAGAVKNARRAVRAAAVVAPMALTAPTVVQYLATCLPPRRPQPWDTLLSALAAGNARALETVSSTAWGLWLIRSVYIDRDRDPTPLLTVYRDDVAALRKHLMDNLVEALLHAQKLAGTAVRRVPSSWDAKRVRRWLGRLAARASASGARDVAWWRIVQPVPDHSGRTVPSTPPRWFVFLLAGLVYGLPVTVGAAPSGHLVLGPAAGLFFGFATMVNASETPDFARLRLGRRITTTLREHSAYVMPVALAMSLPLAAAVTIMQGLAGGLFVGITMTLITWFAFVQGKHPPLTEGKATEERLPQFADALTPLSAWRDNRSLLWLHLIGALALGALLGVSVDFVAPFFPGPWDWLSDLGLGLIVGGLAGTAQRPRQAWLTSRITFLFLALSGDYPVRVMRFYDEMHRLGVLRAVGPFYEFRHDALHDHFTTSAN
ncbi:NACHT domain-containing protein [Nonomuraea guangzhouensis]|uniref:NACHT domain-containing protein n=1 Tax=Nonomuraea guangzhouensis TaxID=1291555 RepID=A0ABW4GUM8_9ACTN|nr:NACHT domain-containing protein [Nonomuraea guangzhouensis]